MRLSVCCDFDGTVCIPDSCDFLLEKFASPEWKELDDAVWRGEITEREAFPKQIELLRVTWEEARAALREGVRIREGFSPFVVWCRAHEVPIQILSSGLRELIEELLDVAGVKDLPVYAHSAAIDGTRWRVVPYAGERLAEHCSHCKCVHVLREKKAGRRVIYIGDGYTDLCPAQHADVLFATGTLAEHCAATNKPFIPFSTFHDIQRELAQVIVTEQASR